MGEFMRFGVCRGLDDFSALESAVDAGIDYLECGFGNLVDFDDCKFCLCKSKLEELHLNCLCANGLIPAHIKLVGEGVDYGAVKNHLDKGFERASELGIKKVVFGSGAARSFNSDFSKERAMEQIVYFLSELVSPRAEKAGSIIAIEPLRFNETTIIHTVSDGLKIAELCSKENIFVLADLYHVYGNKDYFTSTPAINSRLIHSHIAEPINRKYPSADDNESIKRIYAEFFNSLASAGCETCSVEARTENFSEDIKKAISLFRSIV